MDRAVATEHEDRLVLGQICRVLCRHLQPVSFVLILQLENFAVCSMVNTVWKSHVKASLLQVFSVIDIRMARAPRFAPHASAGGTMHAMQLQAVGMS